MRINSSGIAHLAILPVIVILVVASIGAYMFGKSNAYSIVSGQTPYGCKQDPTPTVRNGSTGECVRALQYKLNAWIKYKKPGLAYLIVDGQFGANTDRAVRLFQSKYGLVSDGIVGPKTWTVLFTACNVDRPCTKG
jgi:peptidoglycan hydrolase-like protein with peptidoglycan-binding domain